MATGPIEIAGLVLGAVGTVSGALALYRIIRFEKRLEKTATLRTAEAVKAGGATNAVTASGERPQTVRQPTNTPRSVTPQSVPATKPVSSYPPQLLPGQGIPRVDAPREAPSLAGPIDAWASNELVIIKSSEEANRVELPMSDGPPANAELGELVEEEARRVFTEWATTESFPGAGQIEKASLQLIDTVETASIVPRLLKPSRRTTEFARIGRPGAAGAFLFPNPESQFTPIVLLLFPTLKEDWLRAPTDIRPLRIELIDQQQWRTVVAS